MSTKWPRFRSSAFHSVYLVMLTYVQWSFAGYEWQLFKGQFV